MASRRRYLTIDELEEYADVVVSDSTEAENQISQAEEMIDSYIGSQIKSVGSKFVGQATSGTTTTLTDTSDDSPLNYNVNYFNYCEVEIIAGTNAGSKSQITLSNPTTRSITFSPALSSAVGSTTVYRIRQLGKFPRYNEDTYNRPDENGVATYYKVIPEEIKRAVAAQVQYVIEKGTEFFTGATDDESESIGDYSHSVRKGVNRLLSPKSRELLHGITNRLGELI